MNVVLEAEAIADPIGLVVRLVTGIKPTLTAEAVRQEVAKVAGGRAKSRRLAQNLLTDPTLLTGGGPPVPWSVGQLLLGLRAAGATAVAAPCCGECGRTVSYLISRKGCVICSPCRDKPETCAKCGEERRVCTRDRHGRPRCEHCPDLDGDPVRLLTLLVAELESALNDRIVLDALERATVRPAGQRRLAWAVLDNPELLTGAGSLAPAPAVLRFIDELIKAGATKVLPPSCPRCQRVVALSKQLDGQRICRNCFAKTRAVPCSRCGGVREPAARDADGGPLCPNCLVNDPINLEDCSGCGQRRRVAARTVAGPFCQNCRPRPIMTCGICGREAHCEISRATGQPWCENCQHRWMRCSGCDTTAQLRGGTLDQPLCARCVNPDPDFWDRCPICETTWVLSVRPCQRCLLGQDIRTLLADEGGRIADDLVSLERALTKVERPDVAMAWLRRPQVRELLTGIGRDSRKISHDTLDELPSSKTLDHLRSVLVASGSLPERDERLVGLERWTATTLAARTDPNERKILHAYAVWHHLRRLRRRLNGARATHLQCLNVRSHVTAAANLLDWLSGTGLTLATCTQADLDRWATDDVSYRHETGHFVRWALGHRHAHHLTFPAVRWQGPTGLLDSEKRWDDARRLLQDTNLKTSDRVVGLLLLLYAQNLSAISRLTTEHVNAHGNHVELLLGTSPVVLPEPLADLVLELVETRRGNTILNKTADTPWLFPGRRHGHPLSPDYLGQRLKKIGIHAGRDRSTALFGLATEIPAAILARMLGIHIKVAVAWQQASAGDWMTYAADLSRRTTPS
ncbi:hypothetical protein ABT294_02950 [Nonomuraea sp. NPDC000554]|uniref:hypothetical protein n=1 Tax=Nonomuraea sp. NPDC000554 TaxID=3154259 RepID=UPI00331BED27